MKVKTLMIIVILAILGGIMPSKSAYAAALRNVANTVHNFAFGGPSYVMRAADPSVTQVCVFCHTPHNAGQTRLLWNKANNSNINFRLYTSSSTLTNTTRTKSSLTAGSPSLLCLSCHDGKTAMNVLHSASFGVDAAGAGAVGYPVGSKLVPVDGYGAIPYPMPTGLTDPFTGDPMASRELGGTSGDDLTNDHPIGFSYSAAYSDKVAAGSNALFNNVGMDSAIKFYGPNNRLECSSCHDPHVDASVDANYRPFLVKSNSGSALCLTCHNK